MFRRHFGKQWEKEAVKILAKISIYLYTQCRANEKIQMSLAERTSHLRPKWMFTKIISTPATQPSWIQRLWFVGSDSWNLIVIKRLDLITRAHALKDFIYPFKFPITYVKVNYDKFPIQFLHFKLMFFISHLNHAGVKINPVFRDWQLYLVIQNLLTQLDLLVKKVSHRTGLIQPFPSIHYTPTNIAKHPHQNSETVLSCCSFVCVLLLRR